MTEGNSICRVCQKERDLCACSFDMRNTVDMRNAESVDESTTAKAAASSAPISTPSASSIAKLMGVWSDPGSDEGFSPGDILSHRYQIIRSLGGGGMSSVYQARDLKSEELLAIKVLNQDVALDDECRLRFEREALTMSKLRHPNLLALKAYGRTDQGRAFFVMEFLEGRSLSTEITRYGVIDAARACRIFMQVCDGMAHVHQNGVIHRDLKSGNIYLLGRQAETVKVLDFGIAKMQTSEVLSNNSLTQIGQVMGSPRFMSPEQCLGQKLDHRSDIYSLGCVMYQSLTGVTPFSGDHALNILYKHVNETPPAINLAGGPAGLEAIIMRCLAKSPQERYESMNAVRQELAQIIN